MKTGTNDWFRQDEWNEDIELFFDNKFKRCRSVWTKIQSLSIQGSTLMTKGKDRVTQEKGAELIKRLIIEFQNITDFLEEIIENKYELADYYLNHFEYDLAEMYYREVINYYYDKESNPEGERPGNIAQDADLKLAEVLLKTQQNNKLGEVFDLINNDLFWKEGKGMFFQFPYVRFNYPKIMAFLCDELNYQEEANNYAKLALEVFEKEESIFKKNKTIGKIKTSEKELNKLKQPLIKNKRSF